MKQDRDFHRQVRVVYRACRRLYGKEKTQDECLKVFKVVFPELYKLRNSSEEYVEVPFKLCESLLQITHDWHPHGALSDIVSHGISQLQMPLSWKREKLMQFYEDIMPVVMRIRKLTPRECFRLMDVGESDINTLMHCGLSNSSLYKLAGNSVVVSCMFHLFRKLFIEKENESRQLSLF